MSDKKMNKLFSERLQRLLKERELTQNDLSKILNVSESTVGKWILQKAFPRMGIIQKLAEYFNVPKSYFIEFKTSEPHKAVRIPILGRVVAGIPLDAIEDILGYEEIRPELAATGKFYALKVKGESMEPKIEDGDVVIVKAQATVDSGDIAIVLVNGNEATCKQVKKSKEGIMLIGFNTTVYSPHFYSNEDIQDLPVHIIGKVIELRRSL